MPLIYRSASKRAIDYIDLQMKGRSIISILKQKGDRAKCGNSRGISPGSGGESAYRIILASLDTHIVDKFCPESQCGFSQDGEENHRHDLRDSKTSRELYGAPKEPMHGLH